MKPQDEFDLSLPPTLKDALKRHHEVRVNVPAGVDEAILREAHAGLRGRMRFRRAARWVSLAGGAAAALIALAVWSNHRATSPVSNSIAISIPNDIDGSGRVDIVDAFVVAKHLQTGETTLASWDINHDGKVNDADVNALATAAVRVSESGSIQ